LLERHVRIHGVQRGDEAEFFLDVLFFCRVRCGAICVRFSSLCLAAQALALHSAERRSRSASEEKGGRQASTHLLREHLDVRRVLVPHVALFFVQVQIALFVLVLLAFVFL
jgi:hypothetical protein